MINKLLLKILHCPAVRNGIVCCGDLKEEGSDNLTCCCCESIYPVKNGIPIMIQESQ